MNYSTGKECVLVIVMEGGNLSICQGVIGLRRPCIGNKVVCCRYGDKIICDLVHKNQSTVYPTLFQSASV